MSIAKTLFGTVRQVPERKETGWGAQVTGILDDLIDFANAFGFLFGADSPGMKFSVATSTLAAAATLTPTATLHRVQGTPGAVTLSAATPIAAGAFNGQLLLLTGAHAANTVTIQTGGNVDLNGDITLGLGQSVMLVWNSTRSAWEELNRSN